MRISPTNYILSTDAATEPLTLAEVKTFLRITTTDYDDILTPLIKTARQLCEKITGRDMINKTWVTYLDNFSCGFYPNNFYPFSYNSDYSIGLLKSKLQSITSLEYYIDDVLTTFDATKYYITDEADYAAIYLKKNQSFPSIDDRRQAVKITFVSGYGVDAASVPEALKEGMKFHISALFDNAGDCSGCDSSLYMKFYLPYKVSKLLFRVI